MDIRLMGSVEVQDGTRLIPLARAGERCVLASLALEPGRRIHVDALVDRLWGDDPPAGAGPTIASYIRTVRKAIEDAGGQRAWLRNHRPAAYQLDIDPGLVDYHRFTALVTQARDRQRAGNPADAVARYQEAVELRRAEALGDVTGQWAANRRYAIEQEHLDTVCALYEQQLAIGMHTAVAIHATNLVMDVVPTDRLIVLAVHGLARSGQHAAVRDFLARATRRMWETAQARPSSHVSALARQLIADPDAALPPRQVTPGTVQLPGQPDVDGVPGAQPAAVPPTQDDEPPPQEPVRGAAVVMSAEHNRQVYQAAGDQYIAGD